MSREIDGDVLGRIKSRALERLTYKQRGKTNLYIDAALHQAGETLGPAYQKIVLKEPGILVFADDDPMANFGHECRYLIFDQTNGKLTREAPARFPPYLDTRPGSFAPFHQPSQPEPSEIYGVTPMGKCPVVIPDGNRYAILFSGMSNMRHLNDLEFCYRMLVDRYGFHKSNIQVLNYDGSLNTMDGVPSQWPGDNTAYRINVTGQGSMWAFRDAFVALAKEIGGDDLLFIHTNNHGDFDPYNGQSFMAAYPNTTIYYASIFAGHMSVLPKFKDLIVMMQQCNSGGFNSYIISGSPATNTSIASAATASLPSYGTSDLKWDVFAYEWLSAMNGSDPYGNALAYNPDTNMDGTVEATEAYNYAVSQDIYDTPSYQESSADGGRIALSQKYELWWIWCHFWSFYVQRYPNFPNPPDPLTLQKLYRVLPELQKEVLPLLTRSFGQSRAEVGPIIEKALDKIVSSQEEE
jgi:hypothetical protein